MRAACLSVGVSRPGRRRSRCFAALCHTHAHTRRDGNNKRQCNNNKKHETTTNPTQGEEGAVERALRQSFLVSAGEAVEGEGEGRRRGA